MAPSYPASIGSAASLVIRNGLDGLRRRIQNDLGSFRQWPVLFVSNPILPDHNQQTNQDPSSQGHNRSSRGGRPSASSPSTNGTADVLRKQQHLHDKRQLSKVSHKTQFLLQQQLGLRLLGVEQAFPFSSDHQIEHVRKLASRFSIGSSNGGGGGGIVVGVGSGSCIDLARAMAMSSKGSGNVGTRLVLVPATHVSVMVSGGAASAAASASSQMSKTSSPSSLVPCPPLVLDGDEATLLPFDKGRETSNVTVVQLEATSMVGCTSTSVLTAASIVLDRILQLSRRRQGGDHVDSEEEKELHRLGALLDRLLLGAESTTGSSSSDGSASSQSGGGDASSTTDEPAPLWDSLFDVGRTCLNFTQSSHKGDNSNDLPRRPVPLALAASLAAVVPQSVPDLMACTVPYLLSQMDDSSEASTRVSLESRNRIDRLLRDVPPPLPLEPPLDEYLAMLQANQTLTNCRDDDVLLRQIVADIVSE